jgi:hypothetical protein
MERSSTIILIFILLTVCNILIFIFRNTFHYQPYRSYNELYLNCKDCPQKWGQDYAAPTKKKEVYVATQISNSFIPDTASDFEKGVLIVDHIFSNLGHLSGRPSNDFLELSAMDQYLFSIKGGKDELWCGIYTGIASLFAASQGLTYRNIEIKIGNQSHMVWEVYLKNLKKWFLSDPTFGLLAVTDEYHNLLDLQTFKQKVAGRDKVFALKKVQDKYQYIPINKEEPYIQQYYPLYKSLDFYYYHTSLQKAYSSSEKLKRYVLPVTWYEIYSGQDKLNLFFCIKITFLFFWLVSIFYLRSFFIKFYR